jgi:hypothetical protein
MTIKEINRSPYEYFLKILLGCIFYFFSVSLQASLPNEAQKALNTGNGVSLKMNSDGFKVVSQEILNFINAHGSEVELPDQVFRIPGVMKFKASGISILPHVLKFNIVPKANQLGVDLVLLNLQISIKDLIVEQDYFSALAVHCDNWIIGLGNHIQLPFSADINIGLEDGQMSLVMEAPNWELRPHQYMAYGPRSCAGPLGTAPDFIQRFVAYLSSYSRPIVERLVVYAAEQMLSKLETELNNTFVQNFPVNTPNFGPIPASHLLFGITPETFHLSEQGVDLVLSSKLALNEDYEEDETGGDIQNFPWKRLLDAGGRMKRLQRMTEVGVHPDLINQLLQLTLKKGGIPFEIDRTWSERLNTILSKEELTSYWPDLDNIPNESPYLRAFVKFTVPPQLNASAEGVKVGELSLHLMQVEFMLKVLENGKWHDYYKLALSIESLARPRIDDNLFFPVLSKIKYSFTGKWADGYHPKDRTFDKDAFKELLGVGFTLLDSDFGRDTGLFLPTFKTETSEILLSKFSQVGTYWFLEFLFK